jgi:YggT family protein
MAALVDIAHQLLTTLFYFLLLAVILRFLLQCVKADFYNPISQFLVKVTNPGLKPLRRIIPGLGGLDVSAIVLGLLLQLVATTSLALLHGYAIPNPLSMLIWGSIGLLGLIINIYFIAILVSIILSWVAPGTYNPVTLILHQLTEPVMAPFRKLIPAIAGLDLSPIFVFIAINIFEIIIGHLSASVGLPARFVIGA